MKTTLFILEKGSAVGIVSVLLHFLMIFKYVCNEVPKELVNFKYTHSVFNFISIFSYSIVTRLTFVVQVKYLDSYWTHRLAHRYLPFRMHCSNSGEPLIRCPTFMNIYINIINVSPPAVL